MSEGAGPDLPEPREQIAGLTFALLLLAPDLTIAQVNPAAENLIGRSARRLVGCRFLNVVGFAENRILDKMMSEDAQLLCMLAGANSIFFGEKLLTTGNPEFADDMALLAKAGIEPLRPEERRRESP